MQLKDILVKTDFKSQKKFQGNLFDWFLLKYF